MQKIPVSQTRGTASVLHFTPKFLPDIGGVERHVARLVVEQRRKRIRTEIVSSTSHINDETRSFDAEYRVHRFVASSLCGRANAIVNLGRSWLFILRNLRLILSFDIIFLHDFETFLWILPIVLFLRVPKFITFHGYEGYPPTRRAKAIRQMVCRMTDGSIGIGSFIEKWYGTKLDAVTLPGVDAPPRNDTTGIGDGAIFVGRLAADTGIVYYLEALHILYSSYGIRIPCEICGDGPLRAEVDRYVKMHEMDVTMRGFVANPEQHLPPRKFVFAGGYQSILLAMAYKRPVFAVYDNPLKKDYFESIPHSHELMFIASSSSELARELKEITISGELPIDRIENAYRFASQQTWKRVAGIYEELYLRGGRAE